MLTIGKRTSDPVRVTIAPAQGGDPEAVVVLAPIDMGMRRRALKAARRYLETIGHPVGDGLEGDLLLDTSEQVSRELMRLGVIAIEGIADEATGEVFAITPDRNTRLRTSSDDGRPTGTIDDLLADEGVFARLDDGYVLPDAKRRAEKNGWSGSPNGTSTGATPGKDIANSAARRKRTGAAPNARMKSTGSKATKPKASGRS